MLLPRKHPLALSHPLKNPGLCRKREQVEVVSRLIPHRGIRHPKRHLKSNPGPKAIYQRKHPHLCNDSQVIQIMTYIPSYPRENGHQLMGASSPMKRYQAPTLDREWHILATVPPHPQPLRWCIHRSWG